MNKCDGLWDSLSEYVDGRVAPEVAAVIEQHVIACQNCAADLQFMRETQFALIETPEVIPPAFLRQAIMDATVNKPTALQQFMNAARRWFPVRQTAGLLAAGAAAAILFATFVHGPQPGVNHTGNVVQNSDTVASNSSGVQPPSPIDRVSNPDVNPDVIRKIENLGPPVLSAEMRRPGDGQFVPTAGRIERSAAKYAAVLATLPRTAGTNSKLVSPRLPGTKKSLQKSGSGVSGPVDDMPKELIDMPTVPAVEPKPMMKMNMMDMAIVKNGVEEKSNKVAVGSEVKVVPTTPSGAGRIVLTSSISSSSADNVMNLVALRNSLRQKSDSQRPGANELGMLKKNELLDVYRQRF